MPTDEMIAKYHVDQNFIKTEALHIPAFVL